MGCVFRGRFNQLGTIWYTVLSVLIQAYLLYLGFERYRLYTEMKWPHGSYPQIWLTVYISLLAVCIPLLVLFTAFGVFKSGNLSGDGEQLGLRSERTIELNRSPRAATTAAVQRRRTFGYSFCHCTKSLWQHSPPFPQSIHMVLALCQLFAQQIMLAQLYRYGFINSGDFLNTELDFAFQRSRQLATNLPMGDSRLQGFRITSEELAGSPMAPNLLPILMHARLYGNYFFLDGFKALGIPLEFVNFVVALIAYSCAYPTVFWRLSKSYSFCFSFYLIIHTITIIWSYLAFSILFRVQETNYYSSRPVGIGQYLWSLRPYHVYHPLAIIGIFILTLLLMQIPPILLYAYGFNKYMLNVYGFNEQKHLRKQSFQPANGADSLSNTKNSDSESTSALVSSNAQSCCEGHCPHIGAIAVLILIGFIKAPTIYALTLLYQYDEKPLIFSCLLIDGIYLFAWIILWIGLTFKRNWKFRVIHQVHEILSLQDAHRTADKNIQNKTFTDLKNSLVLMHRDHLFVTDDPFSKNSIMRHVLKSCAHDDIYWLKTNSSNRKNPMDESGSVQRVQYTPELGRLLESRNRAVVDSGVGGTPPSPMAMPPYQRLSSLPPAGVLPKTKLANDGQFLNTANTFGTLQRNRNNNNNNNYRNNNQQHLMGCSYQFNQSATLGRNQNQNFMSQPMDPYSSIHLRGAPNYVQFERGSAEYGTLNNRPGNIIQSPNLNQRQLNIGQENMISLNSSRYYGNPQQQIYSQNPQNNLSTRNIMQHYLDDSGSNYDGIMDPHRSAEAVMFKSAKASPNLDDPRFNRANKMNQNYMQTNQYGGLKLGNKDSQIYGSIGGNSGLGYDNGGSSIYGMPQQQQRLGKPPVPSSINNSSVPIWTAKKTSLTNADSNYMPDPEAEQKLRENQITPSSSITTAASRASAGSNVTNNTKQSLENRLSNSKFIGAEDGTLTKNSTNGYNKSNSGYTNGINEISDEFSTSVV